MVVEDNVVNCVWNEICNVLWEYKVIMFIIEVLDLLCVIVLIFYDVRGLWYYRGK